MFGDLEALNVSVVAKKVVKMRKCNLLALACFSENCRAYDEKKKAHCNHTDKSCKTGCACDCFLSMIKNCTKEGLLVITHRF